MKIIHALASRVIQLLNERGWSAYRLTGNCGIPHSTLCNIILGKCKACNFSTVVNLCRGFNIQLAEFIDSDMFLLGNLDEGD